MTDVRTNQEIAQNSRGELGSKSKDQRRVDMRPKKVHADGHGKPVLLVECRSCGRENELHLPLVNEYLCACGATMYVNTEVLNLVARLEAAYNAQRPR